MDDCEDEGLDKVRNLQELITQKPSTYFHWGPEPPMLKLMRDIVLEVAQLHERGVVHGNLKPETVLLAYDGSFLIPRISTETAAGTYADDMFALGSLLLYCDSGGRIPFGEVPGPEDLEGGICIGEARDIIPQLLNASPEKRPRADQLLDHPIVWLPKRRFDFMIRAGYIVDRVMGETRFALVKSLKSVILRALDGKGYDYESSYDELEAYVEPENDYDAGAMGYFIRYVRNRYEMLLKFGGLNPDDVKDREFAVLCPRSLLIEVYKIMLKHAEDIEATGIDPRFVRDFLIKEKDDDCGGNVAKKIKLQC